MEHRA